MGEVAVVVPVFNRKQPIERLIAYMADREPLVDHFVVVDHGETSVSLTRLTRPLIHHIRRSPDLWFTAALNVGLRYVLAELPHVDVIVLANDDIEFVVCETVGQLTRLVRDNPRSLWASPAILPDGRLLYGAVRVRPLSATYEMADRGRDFRRVLRNAVDSDVLPTRLLVCSRIVPEQIGLLDEVHLPQYGSDYEWTARARRSGFSLLVACRLPVVTTPNSDTERRGRQPYRPPLPETIRRLVSLVRVGSIRSEFEMARLTHSAPLSVYWFLVNSMRIVVGAVLGLARYLFARRS